MDVGDFPRITSLKIDGFKVFDKFEAKLGPLEVIAGANGSGKSSLFAFCKLLSDGQSAPIPPEIVPGPLGENIFHKGVADSFSWEAEISVEEEERFEYAGTILGPRGRPKVSQERLVHIARHFVGPVEFNLEYIEPSKHDTAAYNRSLKLRLRGSSGHPELYPLSNYIKEWRVYNSFRVDEDKIRRSCVVEEQPELEKEFGNISSLLHWLFTEHSDIFVEIEQLFNLLYPGTRLKIKARGAPGEVIGFVVDGKTEYSLADLSDGILRFLCWAVLCLHPSPPTLICIDEPELGLHPRVLPLLAGLFQKASQRTQIILATHSSYFLSQFPLENIAVMRKEDGRAVWKKPADSQTLEDILDDFGQDEIAHLHISDELEHLA